MEPSDVIWLTSRAEHIAEISLLKQITTAAHYRINPAQTEDNVALACKTTRAHYFTQELSKQT